MPNQLTVDEVLATFPLPGNENDALVIAYLTEVLANPEFSNTANYLDLLATIQTLKKVKDTSPKIFNKLLEII